MANMRVQDIGTIVRFTITDGDGDILDLSTYTTLQVIIDRGDDSEPLVKPGLLTTDGTDGKMEYVIEDGDLTVPGTYKFQARIELPTGNWHSTIVKQKVLANITEDT